MPFIVRISDRFSIMENLDFYNILLRLSGPKPSGSSSFKVYSACPPSPSAINHIKDSIYQISTVIQSNSATSEESAAASQELAGQAQVLKSLIGKFRLRNI